MCKKIKEYIFMRHFLVIPMLVILMIFGCNKGTESNANMTSVEEESKSNQLPDEVSQVVQCLHEFIRNKKNDPSILYSGIELDEDLVTNEKVIIKSENKWVVDGWLIQKFNYPDTSSPDPKSVIIQISKRKQTILDAREVFWESGKWTCGPDWYVVASTGYQAAKNELEMVYVRIEKTGENLYEVTDWKASHLDVEPVH